MPKYPKMTRTSLLIVALMVVLSNDSSAFLCWHTDSAATPTVVPVIHAPEEPTKPVVTKPGKKVNEEDFCSAVLSTSGYLLPPGSGCEIAQVVLVGEDGAFKRCVDWVYYIDGPECDAVHSVTYGTTHNANEAALAELHAQTPDLDSLAAHFPKVISAEPTHKTLILAAKPASSEPADATAEYDVYGESFEFVVHLQGALGSCLNRFASHYPASDLPHQTGIRLQPGEKIAGFITDLHMGSSVQARFKDVKFYNSTATHIQFQGVLSALHSGIDSKDVEAQIVQQIQGSKPSHLNKILLNASVNAEKGPIKAEIEPFAHKKEDVSTASEK
jgi:hypothetical protein